MRQALGKGIGALIPSATNRGRAVPPEPTPIPESPRAAAIREIPVGEISVNPRQPREHFDPAALEDLSRSVADHGILQPILVRTLPEGGFELIAGERRLRASRLAGLETVPAVVKDANDAESLVLAIVENVQRNDLSPLEESRAYRALMDEFSLTQDEVATRVGKSRPAVANTIRLLQLPSDVQADLAAGRITAGHARALLALESDGARSAFAREIVQRRLTVRDAEREARRARPPAPPSPVDPDVRRLESDLSRALGTKVSVRPGRASGSGTVEISYFSNDDLGRLAGLLLSVTTRSPGRSQRG